MPPIITPGAHRLWAEHAQDAAELARLCAGKIHVTREDAEKLLRERGLVAEVRKAAAGDARTKAAKKPRPPPATTNVLVPPKDSTLVDPLFLHLNTISVKWKGDRQLTGTVKFRADASRPHIIGKQKSCTRYRIFFEGRKARGAKVSWNKLKARRFVVTDSPQAVVKGRPWTSQEDRALLRRRRARESTSSLQKSLGRTKHGIAGRLSMLTNKNRCARGQGKLGVSNDRSIKWQEEVRLALRKLCGQGTMRAVCAEIEKQLELSDFQRAKAPGMAEPRFHYNVNSALRLAKGVEPTGEKVVNPGRRGQKMVYRLVEVEEPLGEAEAVEPLISPNVRFQNRNLGGRKKSARVQAELRAGGDRRHGD